LAGQAAPGQLPAPAQDVLAALTWPRHHRLRAPEPDWTRTLEDPWRGGAASPGVTAALNHLADRMADMPVQGLP
jgi:acetoin utilization protein AcuC